MQESLRAILGDCDFQMSTPESCYPINDHVKCNGYDHDEQFYQPTDVCIPMAIDNGDGTAMNLSYIISCDRKSKDFYYTTDCSGMISIGMVSPTF